MIDQTLDFYRMHSVFTDPGRYSYLYENLPTDLTELQRIISGIRINFYSDQLVLGYKAKPERLPEIELRRVEKMLAHTLSISPEALVLERPTEKRVVGTCRDSALMMCSMLRHLGIPARIRVGLSPSQLSFLSMVRDHTVCEYWDEGKGRWVILEAELTRRHLDFHRHKGNVNLTDLEFPYFEHAGTAVDNWLKEKTDRYEYLDQGFWFYRNLFLRDIAFLNKVEVNVWDQWGVMLEEPGISSPTTVALLRELCEGEQQSSKFSERARKLYQSDSRLRVPEKILCKCPGHSEQAFIGIWE
jgi:hypothetical protein